MKKEDFIAAVSEKSGLGRRDAEKAVDAVLESISETVAAGDEVRSSGAEGVNSSSKTPDELRAELRLLKAHQEETNSRLERHRERLREIAIG